MKREMLQEPMQELCPKCGIEMGIAGLDYGRGVLTIRYSCPWCMRPSQRRVFRSIQLPE